MKLKPRTFASLTASTGVRNSYRTPRGSTDLYFCTKRGVVEARAKTKRRQHTTEKQRRQRELWCHADALFRICKTYLPLQLWAWYDSQSPTARLKASAHTIWMEKYLKWRLEGFLTPYLGLEIESISVSIGTTTLTVRAQVIQQATIFMRENIPVPEPIRYR